jgi:hypothetical protein
MSSAPLASPPPSQNGGGGGVPQVEGYLYKQGAIVKNWKKRWFHLTANRLAYSEGTQSKKTKGEILIESSTVITPYHSPPAGLANCPVSSPDCCFSISQQGGGRVFFLIAESKEQMLYNWVAKLKQVRRQRREWKTKGRMTIADCLT